MIIDGRDRVIVITESLARVISPRVESLAFVGSHISHLNTEFGPRRSCVRFAAIRIAQLALVGVVFLPRGTAI